MIKCAHAYLHKTVTFRYTSFITLNANFVNLLVKCINDFIYNIELLTIESECVWKLQEDMYLSESLKDGFQHLFADVVMEGPNIEFLWPLSFLQVLCLGCKSEEWVDWQTGGHKLHNQSTFLSLYLPVLFGHSGLDYDGYTKQFLPAKCHCLYTYTQRYCSLVVYQNHDYKYQTALYGTQH